MNLELHKLHKFIVNSEEVVPASQSKINKFLSDRFTPTLPKDWDWRRNIDNKEKNSVFMSLVGRFTSRVTKYFSKLRFYVRSSYFEDESIDFIPIHVLSKDPEKYMDLVFSEQTLFVPRSAFGPVYQQIELMPEITFSDSPWWEDSPITHLFYCFKCDPDSQFLARLGDLLNDITLTKSIYVFSFRDDFNWHAGDFGDGGSCWFSDRREARDVWGGEGGLSVNFYKVHELDMTDKPEILPETVDYYNNKAGFARAWIMPEYPFNDSLVLINGYSKRNPDLPAGKTNDYTAFISQLLSTFLGLQRKRIGFRSDPSNDGDELIYVNGDNEGSNIPGWGARGKGYLLAPQASIEKSESGYTKRFDVSHTRYYHNDNGYSCAGCDNTFDIDDLNSVNGDYYCDQCYNDQFFHCDYCGGHGENDDSYIVRVKSRYSFQPKYIDQQWCASCGECFATYCEDEGEYWHSELAVLDGNDAWHSPEVEMKTCASCNGKFVNYELQDIDGRLFCNTCIDNEEHLAWEGESFEGEHG